MALARTLQFLNDNRAILEKEWQPQLALNLSALNWKICIIKWLCISGSQSVFLPPEDFSEMQILGPHLRPTELATVCVSVAVGTCIL